jgi:hypothetical protein
MTKRVVEILADFTDTLRLPPAEQQSELRKELAQPFTGELPCRWQRPADWLP